LLLTPPSLRATVQALLQYDHELLNDLPPTINAYKFTRSIMDAVQAVLHVRVSCRMQALIDTFGEPKPQVCQRA
jgi:hypothetical protein